MRNSQSIMIVSSSTPPHLDLGVTILVPESPFTGQIATIQFDWQSPAYGGSAAGVTGFGIGDLRGSAGGRLFNFRHISASSYSVQVALDADTTEFTIVVNAHSATLASDTSVTGPAADVSQSFTIALPETPKPIVKIGVPAARPITARPVPLTFDWVSPDGTPVPVQTFVIADITTDVGTIGNFQQVSGDPSKYTAELTVPPSNTSTQATVTVSADSAQVVAQPAVLGPAAATSRTFAIAAATPAVTVTGADSVCVLEKDIVANDYLNAVIPHLGDTAGGAFTGVLEAVTLGSYLYLVVQVRKFTQTVDDAGDLVTPANPNNFLSNAQAGAALVRVNTTTCQFELLKAYSDVTLAARSLAVDGTTLYFMEGSHYMYEDGVIFSDRQWREKVGNVYKIEHPSSGIQDVGRTYRSATTEDNPDTETAEARHHDDSDRVTSAIDYFYGIHGGTTAPMTVVDDALHLLTGYGNFDNIGQPRGKHPVNRIGNWNWIVYANAINQRLSEVVTNGRTGFDVLKAIAILTNSILGFKNDTFFLRPRAPQHAVNGSGSGITATQTTLTAKALNWGEFPSDGWLRIGDELIQHSGADENGLFEDLVRGVEGTPAAAHTGNFDIRFVDHVLGLTTETLEMPITSIAAYNDNRQLFNRVRVRYGDGDVVPVEDAASIAANGERKPLDVDVPLDAHQREWAHWLAESYLARFKDVHQILNLTLKPSFYLNVGDVISLKIPERMHLDGTLCQVLEVRHSFGKPPATTVKLVTL